MKLISTIGCSVSLLGIVLTILTHSLLWKKQNSRSNVPSHVLLHLCIAIGMTDILSILAGPARNDEVEHPSATIFKLTSFKFEVSIQKHFSIITFSVFLKLLTVDFDSKFGDIYIIGIWPTIVATLQSEGLFGFSYEQLVQKSFIPNYVIKFNCFELFLKFRSQDILLWTNQSENHLA